MTIISVANAQINRSVKFQKSDLELKAAKTEDNGEEFQKLKMKDLHNTGDAGKPELPVKYVKLIIPSGMDVSDISINVSGKESIQLQKKVYPAQYPIPTSINYTRKIAKADSVIYNSDNPFPSNLVKVVDEGYFDGNHIVTFAVYPIQYLPKADKIVFYSDIDFTFGLRTGRSIQNNGGIRQKKHQDLYDQMLSALVDNPEDITRYQVKPQIVESNNQPGSAPQTTLSVQAATSMPPFYEYVIITTNDLVPGFDEFIKWKRKKGINIGIVTMDQIRPNYTGDLISGLNDDAGKLRQYLRDAYYSRTTVYALIAGPRETMPLRYGCGVINRWSENIGGTDYVNQIPADLYFCEFDGNWNSDGDEFTGELYDPVIGDEPDYYADIFVGRLLCDNINELTRWVKRVIKYEQNPFDGVYEKITRSLWSQSDDMQEYGQAQSVALNFNSFTHTYIEELPNHNSSTPTYPSGADVVNELNNGYGFYNMYNHGDPFDILVRCAGTEYKSQAYSYGVVGRDADDVELGIPYTKEDGNGLDKITEDNISTIIYGVACSVGQFDHLQPQFRSMAEYFTTRNENGGPAFLGNTRGGWLSSSYLLHEEFIKALFNDNIYHLGNAEWISKALSTPKMHYLAYSHNLFGDPEMPVWTAGPSVFSNLNVTDNGTSVTVNTGITGAEICVSSIDNGASYYLDVRGVGSYTFSTSVRPLYVTVTRQNYIPYVAVTGGSIANNETWSGQLTALGNITVPSGVTLTIKPDANLTFRNGSSLINNGTLTIQGTAVNPVSLDFIAKNSALVNGIKLTPGSSSTINYANIKNAYHGIDIDETYANISNCDISNCHNGIYMNRTRYAAANPVVNHCNIHDCLSSPGIMLYYSSPRILRSTITNNYSGVGMGYQSSPEFGHDVIDGAYGENTISSNSNKGLHVSHFCNPFLGRLECYEAGGYNILENNTSQNIFASDNCIVLAENNWWELIPGTLNINTSKIYSDATSSIDYLPAMSGRPSGLMSMAAKSPEEQVFEEQFNTQATSSLTSAGAGDNLSKFNPNWPIKKQSRYARTLLGMKDYNGVKTICRNIVIKHSDSAYAHYALDLLWQAESKSNDMESFKVFLKEIKDRPEKKDINALAGIMLAGFSSTERTRMLDELFKEYPDGNIGQMILFNKLLYYYSELNDQKSARTVLSEIDKLFPGSETSIEGHQLLGDNMAEPSVSKDEANKEGNTTKKPESYSLMGNYPNPFNPATVIRYELPSSSKVELRVYDILGKEVMILVNGMQEAGTYNVTFNASKLPSGIYIYSFKANSIENGKSFERNSKMLYLK